VKSIAAALVLGAFVGFVVALGACAAQQYTSGADKRDEILALWTQIRDWRREAHMESLDPSPQTISYFGERPVKDAKAVCEDGHKVPAVCDDVCNLADAICDNAESICTIAGELGKDDDFAQDKCRSAKASCSEAKKKCCGCSSSTPAQPPAAHLN